MLETRRINPIARVTFVAVMVLFVFEALVISGLFELKAQTVAKYAPWAYEPFLHLVGEHLESTPRWVAVEEAEELATEPLALPELAMTNETSAVTNGMINPVVPVVVPTNTPPTKPEEIVPVG